MPQLDGFTLLSTNLDVINATTVQSIPIAANIKTPAIILPKKVTG
ncbi:MAG: hypothetical protein QOA57_02975 [Nitrososphaeraceae archaeon]|nr:hypothetical protein [Nitrososphaeraceae archaeon]MDW3614897.1 hypothetical protein [Nitrososphaeraceae archaeon]MDW3667095.1 hypothetical protein [Nitrososphaeraceae archaeon]